jgi:ubiquinone biosynthesis protein UbiJ
VRTVARRSLIGLVTGTLDLAAALGDGTVAVDGDAAVLGRLVALLAPVDPDFAIVTPGARGPGVRTCRRQRRAATGSRSSCRGRSSGQTQYRAGTWCHCR